MNGTLILFTRYPEPGRTKTRLAAELGAAGAADLHRALVEDTLVGVQSATASLDLGLEIHHTGAEADMRRWLGPELCYRPQVSGDLGPRMVAALEKSSPPTVLIGTECPDLTVDILAAAFAALQEKDVVLGPAADGGYYLVGMRQPNSKIFRGIPWSSDQVLTRTRERLREADMSWAEVATLADIDLPEDLALLPRHLLPPRN